MSGSITNLPPSVTVNASHTPTQQPGVRRGSLTGVHNAKSELQEVEESLDTTLFRMLTRPEVFRHLKWAGFLLNYHTLSTLKGYQRTIVPVEDHGLHLLWKSSIHTEYIKPLPEALVAPNYDTSKLEQRSRGLVFSYTLLIKTELDFEIATELKLLPPIFRDEKDGWTKWKDFADTFWGSSQHRKPRSNGQHVPNCKGDKDPVHATECLSFREQVRASTIEFEEKRDELLKKCHIRYQFGDLRLGRIDWIVRLNVGMKGWKWKFYRTRSPRDSFFNEHSTLIAAYVLYVAVILTAMQVSLQAFPTGWTTSVFGIFGYIVIVFTALQVPIIVTFFSVWLTLQLGSFWWINRKEAKKVKPSVATKLTV
jgi:hypothetical protein